MSTHDEIEKRTQEIKDDIEKACADMPRAQYREFLEEIQSYCEIALEALDEDERREQR